VIHHILYTLTGLDIAIKNDKSPRTEHELRPFHTREQQHDAIRQQREHPIHSGAGDRTFKGGNAPWRAALPHFLKKEFYYLLLNKQSIPSALRPAK
jgi:hypothetical protein